MHFDTYKWLIFSIFLLRFPLLSSTFWMFDCFRAWNNLTFMYNFTMLFNLRLHLIFWHFKNWQYSSPLQIIASGQKVCKWLRQMLHKMPSQGFLQRWSLLQWGKWDNLPHMFCSPRTDTLQCLSQDYETFAVSFVLGIQYIHWHWSFSASTLLDMQEHFVLGVTMEVLLPSLCLNLVVVQLE